MNENEKAPKKKPKNLTAEQWEAIAAALYHRVKFALNHFSKQTGQVATESADGTQMELQNWRDYFADGLEKWPGVKIDRELMHALALPRKQRDKEVARIKAARAATPTAKES